MHEAILEDRFLDARNAPGARHQRHELGLKIGGKAGERRRRDIDRADAGAVAPHTHAAVVARHRRARPPLFPLVTVAPAAVSASSASCSRSGRTPSNRTSPPVIATAVA